MVTGANEPGAKESRRIRRGQRRFARRKHIKWTAQIASSTRGQTAEARKTTILQPVEQKPHSQKDRQDEKAEGYVPDEGTR